VLHLGAEAHDLPEWGTLPQFSGLDELFRLQKLCNEARATQIFRAQKACEEKAILRNLGTSVSIPHGWEDLALFASA
jgi:hypothetical protein